MSHTKKSATLLGKTDDFQALLSDMTTAKENAQAAAAGAGLDGIVDTESDLPPAKAGNSGEHWLAHQDSTGRSEAIYRSDGSSWVFTGISLVNNQDPSVNRNVPTVSDLKDTSTTNWNSVFVREQGNYWWEPGRDKADHDGIFVIDPDHSENASPDNSAWFQSQNTGTGCWVRGVPDQINVDKAGAVSDWDGSSGTNNLPLFDAVLEAADTYGVRHIHIPSGDYYLDGTFEIRYDVRVTGEGGYRIDAKTTLHFPANVTGVYVINRNISGGEDTNGTELRRFKINCTSQDTSGHGLHATSQISMSGLVVLGFAEHGVFLDGTGDGSVNQWYGKRVRTGLNGKHGFYIDGSDANAGTGINIDAVSNGEYGIYDSSFLGNTFVGCQTSNNGDEAQDQGGAYKAENSNAHTVFLGCYAEGNQHEIFIEQRCIWMSGEVNSGVELNGPGYYNLGDKLINLPKSEEGIFSDVFLNGPGDDQAYTYKASGASTELAFNYDPDGKNYAVEIDDVVRHNIQFLTSDNQRSMGRSTPPNQGVYARSIFLGFYEEDGRLLGCENFAPDDGGTYGIDNDYASKGAAQGDTVLNNQSGLGDPIGWRCVSAGTPGTWEPFGQAGHRESSGDPTGSVTPSFVGEEVLDTTNEVWYKSTGTSNSDWVALNT